MSLAKLKKVEAHRVLGIDASTNSIAFCIFENDKPVSYGEVMFDGSDVYERMLDAKQKMSALRKTGIFDVDFIAIEAGIMVRSAHVAIKMAYVFGIIMGELLSDHIDVIEIHPITWQSYIGNTNFTKAQKAAVKEQFPNKSDSWYKGKIREMRKNKTLQYMADKGIITDSDNVADAAGLAWYAVNNLTRDNG
jgi:Holliday junction resolvasome RuvABC endonuclease subunit